MKKKDKFYIPLIIVLSIIIPMAVAVLMFMPAEWKLEFGGANLKSLPFFHAVINFFTAILIFTGFVLIKNKKIWWHRACMILAFFLSAVFLISYVVSKIANPEHTSYGGEWGIIYKVVLFSHILLSIPVLPLAMLAIYRGMTGEFQKHLKIVKWTFPIWMYVAITGVLVYVFMAPYY